MSRLIDGPDDATGAPGISRRAILGAAVAGAAGLMVGRVAAAPPSAAPIRPVSPSPSTQPASPTPATPATSPMPQTHAFFGSHQAGITTPAQDHLQLAAFDMAEEASRRDLIRLLRDWSAAAARMTAGLPVTASGPLGGDPKSPPEDTGEAMDLGANRLTITIGFGPGLFERDGEDRFGLAASRPRDLHALPTFKGDALEAAWSGGDLCLQVCADDPLVALHALRNLTRIASERASMRWSQTGFITTSRTTGIARTPRNLMGFKDGTRNIPGDDHASLDEHVWVRPTASPAWLAGGTYLVVRRIAILIEDWDNETLASQERVFGRAKGTGAPLSGGDESTEPDFDARIGGAVAIHPAAHMRLAHPSNVGGIRILRRGYDYFDGTTSNGRLDGGLVFISYQRSPDRFITIQRALETDKLNEYIRPVGSAVFAVPPGASDGGYVGETLLD